MSLIVPTRIPADDDLIRARGHAHRLFDELWLRAPEAYDIDEPDAKARRRAITRIRKIARRRAYRWLAHCLGIPAADCHIARFDLPTLRRICGAVRQMTPEDLLQWSKVEGER